MHTKVAMISSHRPTCDLCSSLASLFCPSDSAFLCCSCDALVHKANFLVARHFRYLLCSICHHFSGHGLSGLNPPSPIACPSCPPPLSSSQEYHLPDSLSSSANSLSVCSSTSANDESRNHNSSNNNCKRAPRRVDHSNFKVKTAERIFVDWCRKLGVVADLGVVRTACRAQSLVVMPFRVCLAASMWVGLLGKYGGRRPRKVFLKRLEEVSGVPAKIILAAEWKLERALRQDRRRRLELLAEGWAEC